MILTTDQIQEVLRIVKFQHIFFSVENIGLDILSQEDKSLLDLYQVNLSDLSKTYQWTPLEQSFYFGQLVQILGQKNINSLSYNDFLQYLRRGQYMPLSEYEKETLKYSKQKTYSYIKKLETQVLTDIDGILIESNRISRQKYEKIISSSVSRAIKTRDSVTSIVSEIGSRTGDWQRNLLRIAETELQNCFQSGVASQVLKEYGPDAKVIKEVYPGACKFCIQFYLTNGIGSQPREFKLSELIANGSNINRHQKDWRPVVESTHPFCRCNLVRLDDDYEWDEEKGKYRLKFVESKVKVKGKIKVWVNDKYFEV